MKTRFVIPLISALLMTSAAVAQSNEPVKVTIPTKFGVVNLQVAIMGTAEGKQATKELQAQFAPRYAEIQGLQKRIEENRARLSTGHTTLSDEEQSRIQQESAQLERSYQRKGQELQDDSNEAQLTVVNRIGGRIVSVLDKYSKENGYAMVLDNSSQQTPVLYAANQIDITQDIIRLYDQNYPVKVAQPKVGIPKQPQSPQR
jgi:outer membrane protein